jgi:response regulator RpfG family c-di-GMP phosphodiesterase
MAINRTDQTGLQGGCSMNLMSTSTSERTLLVISSDQANMLLMTQLITTKRDDLKLLTAPNGKAGMILASESPPQVVVLDTVLSDFCAKEVLKGLHGNPQTSQIPVIAVSPDAQEAQIQAGLNAGFYRYLTKPYKLTDLLDAIDDSLRYGLGASERADARLSA